MRKVLFGIIAAAAGIAGALPVPAAETTTEITTSTVITTTVVKEKTKTKWQPFRVCVLDFTTTDIQGQKRFLDQQNRPIVIPPQNTLNAEDRKSINSVMQGFVRMIDAWDNSKTNTSNRLTQADDNAFTRGKALELYNGIVRGEARPIVIGAEYLAAYLGRRNDVFGCIDASQMTAAMARLQQAPDFPRDFMLRLAKETGATHLIYGTVSDLRMKSNSFKGYGIETQTTNFQLDVIIKMVDLISQHTVYSNVYTGNYREQRPVSGAQIDHNIFQNLMTAALEQAAEDLYDKCKPGRGNEISVTPMPCSITVNPSGGMLFKPASAEIYIDGSLAGNGGVPMLIPAGKYRIEVKAPGYKTRSFDCRVDKDAVINVTLEK
ncbi:MAG: PEGA domain-containing protein [Lentisphaeria bacterium]|nr:PEGA domain-containing protein [Lentisphaeria bacterium]